jgi:hypothetical protein
MVVFDALALFAPRVWRLELCGHMTCGPCTRTPADTPVMLGSAGWVIGTIAGRFLFLERSGHESR